MAEWIVPNTRAVPVHGARHFAVQPLSTGIACFEPIPIFEYSDGKAEELNDQVDFDSDERIDGSFKFDEMDEEYFDSTERDDSEETREF